MLPYAIVEFQEDAGMQKKKSVAIVVSLWLNEEEDVCFWPPMKMVTALTKSQAQPKQDWETYRVRVLGKAGNKLQL